MIQLKGLTWDHPRGYNSIVAATKIFEEGHPQIEVSWQKRSLKDFGDQPLDDLAKDFDLLMIDHPFVGEAHEKGLLVSLETCFDEEFLAAQSKMHIGRTYESYQFSEHQYALPIDAAAQFSAFDSDVLSDQDIPKTWAEFTDLMLKPSFSRKVIWPLCPTDLWCSFLSLMAQIAKVELDVFGPSGINKHLGERAIELIRSTTENISNECWDLNPIQSLELMEKKSYSYCPLIFGYISYAHAGSSIRYRGAVNLNPSKPTSLLGGVGLAISSFSDNVTACADFMKYVIHDDILSGCYIENSGQPSLSSSWHSKELNKRNGNFFFDTLENMNNAYVRPRIPGFNQFQEAAAEYLHTNIRKEDERGLVEGLNGLFEKICI